MSRKSFQKQQKRIISYPKATAIRFRNYRSSYKNNNDLLLYAVTGAGKTEMMFEGIRIARQMGHNIAIVSPRRRYY